MDTYLLKLNSASLAERAPIIQMALGDEGIFHYGRLLISPKLEELAQTEQHASIQRQVEVFCYGTYNEYNADNTLPQLTQPQLEKLKHLTVVSLASESKLLAYDDIKKELGLSEDQQVEDLVIACIYKNLIAAKLDQKRRVVEIDHVIGRDVRREDLEDIYTKLEKWAEACDEVLGEISTEIDTATKNASAKKTLDFEFTKAQQALRTEHATEGVAASNSLTRNDSQFASEEYKLEEQRTGDA
ncbi:COP9 signalosome complex subunit 7b [Coemansia sp. RSA 1939]|nr:COP9 signalosome complex subunit 7b [Coemansia sp. RSA 1939]KAJ2610225.1 COP9 signalosome complex subunit 7b [Coemansia sp. RSA 1804]